MRMEDLHEDGVGKQEGRVTVQKQIRLGLDEHHGPSTKPQHRQGVVATSLIPALKRQRQISLSLKPS